MNIYAFLVGWILFGVYFNFILVHSVQSFVINTCIGLIIAFVWQSVRFHRSKSR